MAEGRVSEVAHIFSPRPSLAVGNMGMQVTSTDWPGLGTRDLAGMLVDCCLLAYYPSLPLLGIHRRVWYTEWHRVALLGKDRHQPAGNGQDDASDHVHQLAAWIPNVVD